MEKQTKFILLLVLLMLVFMFSFYGKALMAPNSYLFSADGDGMKNYYTYAYYIKNNTSPADFEGMNFPYHENFMYTDCHPLQAGIMRMMNRFFPQISNGSIGILNLYMLLSIPFTAFMLYLLFIKMEINRWLSVSGAVAITILSPQVFRLTGHLALSYSFFIPLTIYLLLLYDKKPVNKYILFLILAILFFFYTHAYLGMISSAVVFIYSVVAIIAGPLMGKGKTDLARYLKTMAGSMIPVVIFYLFVKLTDHHTGRTTNPWGIYEYHAELSTVFLPVAGPLNILKDRFLANLEQPWEGWAYTGIVAIAGLAFYIAGLIKKPRLLKWPGDLFIKRLLFTSILIFCLAALLPFRKLWYSMADVFDVIKQFRSIGRFAWAFYFMANIIALYMLDKVIIHFKEHKRKVAASVLIVLVPAFIASEGLEYHQDVSREMARSPNLFSMTQTPEIFQEDIQRIDPDNYQAMIALPFFCIGSENYNKGATNDIYRLSFMFSYHLGLPMVNSYLTRTSIHESKKTMQLLASDFYEKTLRNDLKSNRPFLVICSNDGLSKADSSLVRKSKIITRNENYSLYEIDKAALFSNSAGIESNKFMQKKELLIQKAGFLVSDTNLFFSFIDFNKLSTASIQPDIAASFDQDNVIVFDRDNVASSDQDNSASFYQDNATYFGQYNTTYFDPDSSISFSQNNGFFIGLQREYNTIFSVDGSALDDSADYITRFWIYNDGENFGQDCLNGMIFFMKEKDGKEDWILPVYDARTSHEINGNWTLAEVVLSDIDKAADYKLIIKGPDRSELSYYIDDLLFYDSRLDVYREVSGVSDLFLFHNNHKIKLPE